MFAVLGVSLLAVTVVLFQWAYIELNRPSPKKWTESEYVAHAIALITTGTAAAGVALAVATALGLESHPITATHTAIALAIVGATVVLVLALQRHWVRLRAGQGSRPATVHELNVPANDSGPGIPPRRAGGRGKRRRAA